MARLEELTRGASVKGVLPDGLVTIVDVTWHGSDVVELIYRDAAGPALVSSSLAYWLARLRCDRPPLGGPRFERLDAVAAHAQAQKTSLDSAAS